MKGAQIYSHDLYRFEICTYYSGAVSSVDKRYFYWIILVATCDNISQDEMRV